MLVSLVHHILTAIIYPLAFLFRHKILAYAEKRITENPETKLFETSVKKWRLYINPLFWGFLFTTGLTNRFAGQEWFKKELKEKWFGDEQFSGETIIWAIEVIKNDNFPLSLKEKLQYFYLCYCWGGLRNAGWAFQQWFLTEGAAKEETIELVKNKMYIPFSPTGMPNAKFKDADGTDRNNSGPYIKYDGEGATQEGTKIITFETHKGKRRFKYAFCKIYKEDWIKKFLVIELVFGWDTFDGMAYWHSKFMFKKMDELSISDFEKYKEESTFSINLSDCL